LGEAPSLPKAPHNKQNKDRIEEMYVDPDQFSIIVGFATIGAFMIVFAAFVLLGYWLSPDLPGKRQEKPKEETPTREQQIQVNWVTLREKWAGTIDH
jgi:hypothetical protein